MHASAGHLVTLRLPDILYRQVERLAQSFRRPMEEVLLDAVSTALPPLAGLPQNLADELADLAFLNDSDLWQVARSTLPVEHYEEVDALLALKSENRLTSSDQDRLEHLLQEYQSLILRRAQAAMLLQRRGYEMSDPAVLNTVP
jgi:hypothetical protein